jgi:hypothetical protein
MLCLRSEPLRADVTTFNGERPESRFSECTRSSTVIVSREVSVWYSTRGTMNVLTYMGIAAPSQERVGPELNFKPSHKHT